MLDYVRIDSLVSLVLVVQAKELLCRLVRVSLLQSSGEHSRNICFPVCIP